MVQNCEKALRSEAAYRQVPIQIDIVKEQNSVGNATGIMWVDVLDEYVDGFQANINIPVTDCLILVYQQSAHDSWHVGMGMARNFV